MNKTEKASQSPATGRHAAGSDPVKRDQILDGASRVFLEKGYDGASMNDICKAAGVSKGTLYVYFADKLDLFEALFARKRERFFRGLDAELNAAAPLAERLARFSSRLAEMLCSDEIIRAQRIVIGSAEKMPDMAVRFYESGASHTLSCLTKVLEQECAAGQLSIKDPRLAATQLIELSTAGLWRCRLFGKLSDCPSQKEIEAVTTSAVSMFLNSYGTGTKSEKP